MRVVNVVLTGRVAVPLSKRDWTPTDGHWTRQCASGGRIHLFSSGKVMLAGFHSRATALRFFKSLGLTCVRRPVVRNMVCVARLPQPVDLKALAARHPKKVRRYSPRYFKGALVRLLHHQALLTDKGRAVFVGYTSKEEAQEALSQLQHLLPVT